MGNNLGPGVSRVLSPVGTQYTEVIWQQGKPPLDSELNLLQDLATNWRQIMVMRGTPSGWLGNETNPSADYITNAQWSNWFRYGRQRTGEQQAIMWAVVNGWLIPVTGTRTGSPPGSPDNTDTWNKIALDPPPSNAGDFRIDFVFFEAWLARVPPNPSTLNKPAASAVYLYGNVEGGYSFLPDDIQDPSIGAETTERVQLQYRIRVQKGLVGFTSAPDGFDPAVVFAQGAASTPTTYNFVNMRSALGDPGLWRAGDGSSTAQTALGTVDGFSYAIPIAAVFRRNSVAWLGDPSPNLNGAFNRNITAVDRTGIQTFSTVPTIAASMTATATSVNLVSVSNIPLPTAPAVPVLIQIGDELMTYTGITGTTLTGITRGVNSSRAEFHAAGSVVTVLSGRPDGLFADQVAKNDILDLRHVVNPNGFDYDALLRYNFDKLIRGNLRSNWKRTGAGPQGPFVIYQDKVVATGGSVALGITRLDGPDNIRKVFSDAAVPQTINFIAAPAGAIIQPPTLPVDVTVSWDLELTINAVVQNVANQFNPNDQLTIPIAQFKGGLPGGDQDQVRFINDGLPNAVVVRVDGQTNPLPATAYTVTPANPGPNDDLTITFNAGFPSATAGQIYVDVQVQYGPGRGVARRPDSFHGVAFENPSNPSLLYRPTGVPQQYSPMHVGWAAAWSAYRNVMFKGVLPQTVESYADPGSKTLVLTPFRTITFQSGSLPATGFTVMDGTAANVTNTTPTVTGDTGATSGTTTLTDASAPFLNSMVGSAVQITTGPAPGRYTLVSYTSATAVVLDRAVPTATGLSYTVTPAQGLMPNNDQFGAPKWTTTDPLNLFSSGNVSGFNPANAANLYVHLPRNLVPAWGEYHVPILPGGVTAIPANFSEGVNYGLLTNKGSSQNLNYVPYVSANGGGISFQTFSTLNFGPPQAPATYNTAYSLGGLTYAGMRKFSDPRGLNRQGLELPPFYGCARLFAVYEANDYFNHGSAYDPTTRNPVTGRATNLLRQNEAGATFWVEKDADGDSTYILNADCIDLSRSPTPITSFAAADFVIEASIFGFDRNFFDLGHEARLVLSATRTQAIDPTRANNIGPSGSASHIVGPITVLPGPLTGSDAVVTNYSRTPYMGDAWGSQTNYIDISYAPGPLLTGNAYQLVSTNLNQQALTRPNQKLLEVLASIGFETTLGTGRPVGDFSVPPAFGFTDIGYENPSQYPPTSPVQARPTTLNGAFIGDSSSITIGSDILGMTERMPLGALFRDKDFRGEAFGNPLSAPFVLTDTVQGGLLGSIPAPPPPSAPQPEIQEAQVQSVDLAIGQPGDLLVHVDGNQGNYSLLTNYRVNRGGSVFNASGPRPGGEVATLVGQVESPTGHTNVLVGRAFLVRNTVTDVGATEVSAGDELMMLVVTSVNRLTNTSPALASVIIGTNGSNEGYAAADIYRIEGHPLMNDNVRNDLDPSTINLAPRAF
jgi:hypothetical protein